MPRLPPSSSSVLSQQDFEHDSVEQISVCGCGRRRFYRLCGEADGQSTTCTEAAGCGGGELVLKNRIMGDRG